MFSSLVKTEWLQSLTAIADVERRNGDNKELHDIILDFILVSERTRECVFDAPDLHTTGSGLSIRTPNVYIDGADVVANKLANTVATHFSFVILRTMEPRFHYTLMVNGLPAAEIRDISKLLRLKFLMPVVVEYGKWKINILPSDIYLIEAYHKLCNPAYSDKWDEIKKSIHERNIAGGSSSGEQIANQTKEEKQDLELGSSMNEIVNALRGHVVFGMLLDGSPDFLILGRPSISLITWKTIEYFDQLQLISRIHINDATAAIIAYIKSISSKIDMHVVGQNINVPFDFRLRKYIIYVSYHIANKREQRPLLEIFTSAQYELVPYCILADIGVTTIQYGSTSYECPNLRIAHPLVTLRFQYIDIWILKVLLQDGKLAADTIKHLMLKKTKAVELIHEQLSVKNFTMDKWLGKWSNPDSDYKMMMFKKKRDTALPTYPYKPYLYYQQHGSYRVFGGGSGSSDSNAYVISEVFGVFDTTKGGTPDLEYFKEAFNY